MQLIKSELNTVNNIVYGYYGVVQVLVERTVSCSFSCCLQAKPLPEWGQMQEGTNSKQV